MKKYILFRSILILFLFISCRKEYQINNTNNTEELPTKSFKENNSDHIKIAVVTDIHYMDTSLLQNNGQNGTAFQNDRGARHYALVEFSVPIFSQVISELLYEKPDIVLIAGDLAKEGERVSHLAVAIQLQQLQDAGIKVYVVPGHSDINNPNAKAYNGNTTSPVSSVNPIEFTSIYSHFGFDNAKARDPNSLSYIAEPHPGLWILAIDDAKYSPTYARGGRINLETMQWIREQMVKAKQDNITVLGLMHHSLIEHYEGQTQATPNFVIDDSKVRADSLISYGLKVIFTGHAHATDITMRVTEGKTLYDIQTGSTVTPPSSYRLFVLKNKELDINTNYITSIPATLPGNLSFEDYSIADLSSVLEKLFRYSIFPNPPYSITDTTLLNYITPLGRNAYMAYIKGDENISPLEQQKIDSLNFVSPKPALAIWNLTSLWTDLNTKDIKWHIKLTNP